jgi:glutamate-1-semialdehyde 2,1-aminomutase
MTAGIATLKALQNEVVYPQLEQVSSFIEEGIHRAIQKAGLPASFQRVGSMGTLFFTPGPVRNYQEAKKSDTARFAKFFWAMARREVYLPPSQFECWFFSDALTLDLAKKIVRSVGESLEETLKIDKI